METTDIKTINDILNLEDFTVIMAYATDVDIWAVPYETIAKQYEITGHKVFDPVARPKKTITEDTGVLDANGQKREQTTQVEVCRIGYPAQWLIVERSVGFLLGYPVKLKPLYYPKKTAPAEELFTEIQRQWRKQKLDYLNRRIARITLSERECAEIWYFMKDKTGKPALKVKLACNSNVDKLYPKFDVYGDLVMFSRQYTVETKNEATIEHFDIYTADRIQFWERTASLWSKTEDVPNDFEKIPVIYYRVDKAEWERVQTAIERYEESLSNHGDTNDYTGSPTTLVEGEIRGWSKKGERGKVLELEPNSKVSMLQADGAPESIKMEREDVKQIIFSGSQTPDISFYEMRNVGGVVSGTALDNMYLDARMKAKNHEEIFGEMFIRRCNVMKAAICNQLIVKLKNEYDSLEIDIEFIPFTPKNKQEETTIIAEAKAGGFLSTESAVRQLGMIENVDEELARLETDKVQTTVEPFV
jgi:SPP1 family phage portal protein